MIVACLVKFFFLCKYYSSLVFWTISLSLSTPLVILSIETKILFPAVAEKTKNLSTYWHVDWLFMRDQSPVTFIDELNSTCARYQTTKHYTEDYLFPSTHEEQSIFQSGWINEGFLCNLLHSFYCNLQNYCNLLLSQNS